MAAASAAGRAPSRDGQGQVRLANRPASLAGGSEAAGRAVDSLLNFETVKSFAAEHYARIFVQLKRAGFSLDDICAIQACTQRVTYDRISDVRVALEYYLRHKGPGTSNIAAGLRHHARDS